MELVLMIKTVLKEYPGNNYISIAEKTVVQFDLDENPKQIQSKFKDEIYSTKRKMTYKEHNWEMINENHFRAIATSKEGTKEQVDIKLDKTEVAI